jgi:hypothetical protein
MDRPCSCPQIAGATPDELECPFCAKNGHEPLLIGDLHKAQCGVLIENAYGKKSSHELAVYWHHFVRPDGMLRRMM